MRNYYDAIGLERSTPSASLKQTLNAMPAEQLADEGDLEVVLTNDKWRAHYRRVHLQYDAIAAALANPALSDLNTDSHQWDKRVIEFEPEQNTIEL